MEPPLTLRDQYSATYSAVEGDSGSPVYIKDATTHDTILVGLHIAYNENEGAGLFSPVSGIMTDLGVTPLIG